MTSTRATHSVGVLVTGADWAVAHGDIDALAHVMRELSVRVQEPLSAAVAEIDNLCSRDPDRACASWWSIRARVVADPKPQ